MPTWSFWTLFGCIAVYIAWFFMRMLTAQTVGSLQAIWRGSIPEQQIMLTVRRELQGAKRIPVVYLTGSVAMGMRGARLSAEEAVRLAGDIERAAREARP